MMNRKTAAFIFSLAIVAIAAFAAIEAAYAQVEYKPLVTLPNVTTKNEPTNPIDVLKGLYGLAIGVGAVLAVVMIIIGGFKYMYQESIFGKSDARNKITNAFVGLLVILASYVILRTINEDLVAFNLYLPGGSGTLERLVSEIQEIDKRAEAARVRQANLRAAIEQKKAAVAETERKIADLQTRLADAEEEISGVDFQTAELLNANLKVDEMKAELATAQQELEKRKEEQRAAEIAQLKDLPQSLGTLGQLAALESLKSGQPEVALSQVEANIEAQQRTIDKAREAGVDDATIKNLENQKVISSAEQKLSLLTHSKNPKNELESGGKVATALISEISVLKQMAADNPSSGATEALRRIDNQILSSLGCKSGYQIRQRTNAIYGPGYVGGTTSSYMSFVCTD